MSPSLTRFCRSLTNLLNLREREYLDREFAKAIECAILQAAISGKLTKQHPEDGTAAELLEQIAAERDALVKVGKLKKHKSLPPVTDDEEYFDIPDTWEWTRFSELAIEVCTGPFGSALHRRDYVDDGTPVINPSNIVGDTFVPTVFVNEETSARLSSFALAHGDLVIGRRGEMGRSAVVSEAEAGWLCGTGCFYAKSGENHVFDYVALTLKAPSVRAQLSSSSLGTTMQNLNQTTLRRLPLAVPSRREQLRIDAKLGQLKAPMRSLQQLLQNA